MEELVYYQSTCLEFRYGDGKVLGTQPHLTHGLASFHCILCLNLIKNIFNTTFQTQTHASIHLSKLLNPNIHLSWHRNVHKPKATNKHISYPRQKPRHVRIKQTCYHIQGKAFANIVHIHQSKINTIYLKQMHVRMNA